MFEIFLCSLLTCVAPTLQEIDAELKSAPSIVEVDTVIGTGKSVIGMLQTGLDIETDQYVCAISLDVH